MITFEDAQQIVHSSVDKATKRSSLLIEDTLVDLGIESQSDFQDLIQTIVDDPDAGTKSLSAKVEPAHFGNLTHNVTVLTLINALQLSARKLCSNTTSAHEQPCCPYPKICAECGFKVL